MCSFVPCWNLKSTRNRFRRELFCSAVKDGSLSGAASGRPKNENRLVALLNSRRTGTRLKATSDFTGSGGTEIFYRQPLLGVGRHRPNVAGHAPLRAFAVTVYGHKRCIRDSLNARFTAVQVTP